MAPQQGFAYEINAYRFLSPYHLVPQSFTPAGASHDQPDLVLQHKSQLVGCELKITSASAGSLALYYDVGKKTWGFQAGKSDEKEKAFLIKVATDSGALKQLNRAWGPKGRPWRLLREQQDTIWQNTAGRVTEEKRYKRDQARFPEQKGSVSTTYVEQYYQRKKTDYVNIGTHGFFLMGPKNPLKLVGVPRFSQAAKTLWRARVQYKGGGSYQFVFELSFAMTMKSPFNIAPIAGSGSVAIIKSAANLSCFQ